MRAFTYATDASGKFTEGPVPPNLADEANAAREALVEMVAEADDSLMERFFEEGTLSQEELVAGLRKAVLAGKVFPLVCTSAAAQHRRCSPSSTCWCTACRRRPIGRSRRSSEDRWRGHSPSARPTRGPPAAFVWKTLADPFAGRITLFRVVSGTMKADTTVHNLTKDTPERLGALLVPQGKTQSTVGGTEGRGHRRGREAQGDPDQRHARRQAQRGHVPADVVRRPAALVRHRAEDPAATRTRSAPPSSGSAKRTRPSSSRAIRRRRSSCCRARASCTSR